MSKKPQSFGTAVSLAMEKGKALHKQKTAARAQQVHAAETAAAAARKRRIAQAKKNLTATLPKMIETAVAQGKKEVELCRWVTDEEPAHVVAMRALVRSLGANFKVTKSWSDGFHDPDMGRVYDGWTYCLEWT